MPTTFQDREQAFEAKFAHDQELRFKVMARRDKLFARWAADRLHLPAEAADGLVKDVLSIPDKPGHDAVLLRHVSDLLAGHNSEASEADLVRVLAECLQQAMRQLNEPGADPSGAG